MPIATVRNQPELLQPEDIPHSPVKCEKRSAVRRNPRRKLVFNQVVNVRPIKHLDNMSDEEVNAIWFSREDFEDMKDSYAETVRMISKGAFKGDDDEHCARGLEYRTREGAFKRKTNKWNALQAVLDEQDRQQRLGINDDELLREAYVEENLHCRLAALELGIQDQDDALAEYETEVDQEEEDSSLEELDYGDIYKEKEPLQEPTRSPQQQRKTLTGSSKRRSE
jgi:hypothetical protein